MVFGRFQAGKFENKGGKQTQETKKDSPPTSLASEQKAKDGGNPLDSQILAKPSTDIL